MTDDDLERSPGPAGPGGGTPENDDMKFARNMLWRREERGLSQADLVKAVRELGWSSVHQTTISRIEKGERPVRLGEARIIAEALDVELTQLLLTPDDSKIALQLAAAREQLETIRQQIKNRTVEHFKLQRRLHDAFSEGIASGLEPTMVPHAGVGFTSSGSAEDELGLAEHYLRVSPEEAVVWGRYQYKYLQASSSDDEPDSLDIDQI